MSTHPDVHRDLSWPVWNHHQLLDSLSFVFRKQSLRSSFTHIESVSSLPLLNYMHLACHCCRIENFSALAFAFSLIFERFPSNPKCNAHCASVFLLLSSTAIAAIWSSRRSSDSSPLFFGSLGSTIMPVKRLDNFEYTKKTVAPICAVFLFPEKLKHFFSQSVLGLEKRYLKTPLLCENKFSSDFDWVENRAVTYV